MARGEQAFQAFVRRSSDRRLERIAGSRHGLRIIFAAMTRAYRPGRAAGFSGDIRYVLSGPRGTRTWTVHCAPDRATAEPRAADAPALTIRAGLADFIRIAARELDPAKALLSGRLDLEGDFAVATRLGEMFGQPSAY